MSPFAQAVFGLFLLSAGCRSAPAPGVAEAAPPASAATPAPASGSLPDRYIALRETGCDPSPIGAPMVARALRNTPFAMAGRPFTSPELTALFEADGGWYAPQADGTEVALSPADQACVAKLQTQERILRRQVCLSAETEAALLRDHGALLWLVDRGLPGLIEGTQPSAWTDPGFDACASGPPPASARLPWAVTRWVVTLTPVTNVEQGIAALKVPDNLDLMGVAIPSGTQIAQQRRELEVWLQAGRSVRSLYVEVLSEDHPYEDESYEGQVVRHCVGPDALLDGEWICWGYSLP